VIDDDRPSDHVDVPTVPLRVAKGEGVNVAVSGSHNCIMAKSEAPDAATGIGVCTERTTSDASFTYKCAFINATLLFAATDGGSVLLLDHKISGREKRHW
jgi:hypothetical protein